MSTDELITSLAGGLTGRLRSLVMVLDRLDRLEAGSGAWQASFESEELPQAATEFTLRAWRTIADPGNFAILKTLATAESHALTDVLEATGLDRLTLSERLNDLVQVGLALRLIETDHAQITTAGADAVRLVETMATNVVQQYQAGGNRR